MGKAFSEKMLFEPLIHILSCVCFNCFTYFCRNYPTYTKKPTQKYSLTQWVSKNLAKHQHFQSIPDHFQRSPVTAFSNVWFCCWGTVLVPILNLELFLVILVLSGSYFHVVLWSVFNKANGSFCVLETFGTGFEVQFKCDLFCIGNFCVLHQCYPLNWKQPPHRAGSKWSWCSRGKIAWWMWGCSISMMETGKCALKWENFSLKLGPKPWH